MWVGGSLRDLSQYDKHACADQHGSCSNDALDVVHWRVKTPRIYLRCDTPTKIAEAGQAARFGPLAKAECATVQPQVKRGRLCPRSSGARPLSFWQRRTSGLPLPAKRGANPELQLRRVDATRTLVTAKFQIVGDELAEVETVL
jgi:hypothetical protein